MPTEQEQDFTKAKEALFRGDFQLFSYYFTLYNSGKQDLGYCLKSIEPEFTLKELGMKSGRFNRNLGCEYSSTIGFFRTSQKTEWDPESKDIYHLAMFKHNRVFAFELVKDSNDFATGGND